MPLVNPDPAAMARRQAYADARHAELIVEKWRLILIFSKIFKMDPEDKLLIDEIITDYVGMRYPSQIVGGRDRALIELSTKLNKRVGTDPTVWDAIMDTPSKQERVLRIRKELRTTVVAAGLLARMLATRL